MKKEDYLDKVYGCWLGKCIGGTIGVPFEGRKDFLNLPAELPERIVPNDDLDLQLVWLDILRKNSTKITSDDFIDAWVNNIGYAFDEYGVAIANLKMGLKPPVTGYYNNWFKDGMGASIRSEIWACIAPGKPEAAGWYAYQDACVDHWDEGVYGEIFLACLESRAFFESNLEKLIRESSLFLPEDSKVRKAVEFSLESFTEKKDVRETRDKILERFGHYNFTDCSQNIAFITLGLLYGQGDFLQSIVTATNCGYDTDCTGATCGAIAGLILGGHNISKKLGSKFNENIAVGKEIKGIEIPKDVVELTRQTVEIGEKMLDNGNLPEITKPFLLPPIAEETAKNSAESIFAVRLPFFVSEFFTLNEADTMEKSILHNSQSLPSLQDVLCKKTVIFNNSHFNLNPYLGDKLPGFVFLSAKLRLNENRKLKIFPCSNDGIKMWIDGKLLLSHHQHTNFLPAPHRPGSPLVEVELIKGWHELILEVICCKKPLEFAWIVADAQNHLVTDLKYFEYRTR